MTFLRYKPKVLPKRVKASCLHWGKHYWLDAQVQGVAKGRPCGRRSNNSIASNYCWQVAIRQEKENDFAAVPVRTTMPVVQG